MSLLLKKKVKDNGNDELIGGLLCFKLKDLRWFIKFRICKYIFFI